MYDAATGGAGDMDGDVELNEGDPVDAIYLDFRKAF